ncbi:MAG: arylamine N-acetyltransferase, partial [Armatimonadetes bacterium]|nr:arylamine N-acetyltransferase [Armatimonadota bacterium]
MPNLHTLDLGAYRARIGFVGEFEPTLDVLHQLALRHACSIPFENLDILLGRGISLDLAELEKKLIHDRRGGYCFEQNGLMLGILRQIGFQVTPLAGRVRLDRTRDFLPPRTHLFLVVDLDGVEWFFDVGVGGYSLTSPILRNEPQEQTTIHETRRIVIEEGKFFHQARSGDGWIDVYEFTGEEMPEIDREVANWWTSTSPNAKFSQNLNCALALENGERLGLMNDRFIRRRGEEILDQTTLTSADQLLD